jgi:tetratricopeptide (TPR) repeat protein
MPGIFISHTHNDKALADALSELVEELFGDKVAVNYSSRKELDGGIGPGQDWFRWIVEQVSGTDVALILLTPGSIQKPWLLWEAGAVAGTAFAKANDKANVFPMSFGIRGGEVPTPFARTQVLSGTDQADMVKLLDDLIDRFGESLQFSRRDWARFGEARPPAVKAYLDRINPILLKLPLSITEAAVQEWLGRLAELERENRFSEAGVMEDWLNVAFGRADEDDKARPFDVRIHRQLGELYSRSKRPADAARQFQLACKLAPRDIFLLRRLGKAYLDQSDMKRTAEVLGEIESLDKKAFEINSETAALKARYFEESGNLAGARDVLEAAFATMPTSYYLGDKLGQVLIKLGATPRAKEIYEQVGRILDDLREQNVWTYATRLSAAIVCENDTAIASALDRLRGAEPSPGQLDSIERGLTNLGSSTGRDNAIRELRAIERRQ